MNFLRTLRQRFSTEKRGNSSLRPSLFSIIFFDTIVFVEHRRVPLWSFSVLRENIFSMEDRDITFSSRKFSIPCFDDTLRGSPTKISPQWDNKFSIENRYTLFSGINFFDTWNFLKHRSFPLRIDSVLWDKTIWRKIVILASSLIAFFRYQIFCQTQKGSSTIFLRTVTQKFLTEKRDNPSLPPSLFSVIFSIPEFWWNTERFPYEVFRYFQRTFFVWKIVTKPSQAENFRYPVLMTH